MPPFQETAATTGQSGFEIGITSSQALLRIGADAWATAGTQAVASPPDVLVLPAVTLRKGLGGSFELGASFQWLTNSQMMALSGGELARVLLARAIAGRPELLILDEPLAGVDVAGEAALYHLIAEIRDELGCGILLVSHDLHVVMAQADRVVCLNGHVCCEGRAEQVVQDPAFAQLFGPRVASELALYVHRHDHSHAGAGHG